MKLNQTYNLDDVFTAISKASDNHVKVINEMITNKETTRAITQFDTKGMLTTSQFARVTFTRKTNDVIEGYMGTSFGADGPKTPVSVIKRNRTIKANANWHEFQILNADNEVEYVITLR